MQFRMARGMFDLGARDLYELMRAYGVESSRMTLWRAEQSNASGYELQQEMRRVYQSLGVVFYENHGASFEEENAPTEAEIQRIRPPRKIIEAFQRLRNEGVELKSRTKLVRKMDGEAIVRPGGRRIGRLNLPDNHNTTTEKAVK